MAYDKVIDGFLAYIHALDGKRWQEAAAQFLPDGVLAFGADETVGPAAIAPKIESDLSRYPTTQHNVSTPRITIDGEHAHLTANATGHHLRKEGDFDGATTVGGRYEADLVRTPDGWKIARVAPVYLWRSGPPLDHGRQDDSSGDTSSAPA